MDEATRDVCLVSHQQHRTLSLGREDSAFVLGKGVRNQGIGVAMPHTMLLLEPGDMLHVLGRGADA